MTEIRSIPIILKKETFKDFTDFRNSEQYQKFSEAICDNTTIGAQSDIDEIAHGLYTFMFDFYEDRLSALNLCISNEYDGGVFDDFQYTSDVKNSEELAEYLYPGWKYEEVKKLTSSEMYETLTNFEISLID